MNQPVMQQNVGGVDRYIRITLGGLALTLGAARMARHQDFLGFGLGLMGGMMIADGVLGTCPLYTLLGVNTHQADLRTLETFDTNDTIEPYEGI